MDKDFKPDWKDAPEWAKFLAQDKDGSWYWFEKKPFLHTHGFWILSGQGRAEFIERSDLTPICEPRPSGQSHEQ